MLAAPHAGVTVAALFLDTALADAKQLRISILHLFETCVGHASLPPEALCMTIDTARDEDWHVFNPFLRCKFLLIYTGHKSMIREVETEGGAKDNATW